MKKILPLLMAVLLAALVFGVGCSEEAVQTDVPTQGPTATSTPAPQTPVPTATFSLVPSPTDVVPTSKGVEIQVNRDQIPVNPVILIEFRGGKGQYAVTDLDVTVYLSNGMIVNEKLGRKVGDELEIVGTTGTDRVVVVATFTDTTQYKVYDAVHEFRPR